MDKVNYSIQDIAPGLVLLKMPLPFRLDHINLYLLEDIDGWILIDTGLNTETTKTLWIEFLQSGFFVKPLKKIVLTHLHPDHIGMSGWLSEHLAIPVCISRDDWEMANFLWNNDSATSEVLYKQYWNNFGIESALRDELLATRLHYKKLVKQLPKNVEIINEKKIIEVTGTGWTFIATPGHSPGHLCLWNPAQRILISGDHVLPTITPNISYHPVGLSNPLGSYLRSLEKLLALDCELYLPAHGPASSNLHERVDQLIAHHQQRLALLTDDMDGGKTVHEATAILFPQQLPPHQLMFAYAEAAAHLLYLFHKKQLTRDDQSAWVFKNPQPSLAHTC